MRHLSVKISEELLQQLIEKGRQMGVDNISDAVRMLLIWALENREEDVQRGKNKVLLHQATNHSIITHCLIEGLLTSMEGGDNLRDLAYAKAEKIMTTVLEE